MLGPPALPGEAAHLLLLQELGGGAGEGGLQEAELHAGGPGSHLAHHPVVVALQQVAHRALVDPGALAGGRVQANLLEIVGFGAAGDQQLPPVLGGGVQAETGLGAKLKMMVNV